VFNRFGLRSAPTRHRPAPSVRNRRQHRPDYKAVLFAREIQLLRTLDILGDETNAKGTRHDDDCANTSTALVVIWAVLNWQLLQSSSLGAVHGHVGIAQQTLHIPLIEGLQGDSQTRGHEQLSTENMKRLANTSRIFCVACAASSTRPLSSSTKVNSSPDSRAETSSNI